MVKETNKNDLRYLLLIILIGIILLFYRLGDNALANWDEAWYADISRTMFETGNFLASAWNHSYFFDKPPLYYWISALSMGIFGVNEFSVRFPSAVSALLLSLLVFQFGKEFFNLNPVRATYASLTLLSTVGFMYRSRTGNMDTFLTLWIFLSIYAWYKLSISKSKHWNYVFGIALGLAFLTKGTIAWSFPAVLALYALASRRYYIVWNKDLAIGIFISLVIALFWLSIMSGLYGVDFFKGFFGHQLGKVSTTGYFWQNASLEFINFIIGGLKLWILPFFASIIYGFAVRKKENDFILMLYIVLFLVFLIFIENKSNWFLVPIYPVTALVIGKFLAKIEIKMAKFSSQVMLIFILILGLVNILRYKTEIFVPDVSRDESNVATAAGRLLGKSDVIYLTHYYFPTTIYYSRKKVYAVFSEQQENDAWFVKPISEWENILKQNPVYIITTKEDYDKYQNYFGKYKFIEVYRSGEKLLIKKI